MEHFSQTVCCSPLAKMFTPRVKLVISWPDWVVRSSGSLPRRPTAVMFSICFWFEELNDGVLDAGGVAPALFLQKGPELGVEGPWEAASGDRGFRPP